MDAQATQGAAVAAEGLGMHGPRGRIFGDVTLDAPPGALVAVRGPSGSGRTCLLLALTGRMRPSTGRAEVDGHRLPGKAAAVRRISALGPVASVTDLEPALSVGEHLRERVLLTRRFTAGPAALVHPRRVRSVVRASRTRTRGALTTAGLDPDALPAGLRTRVRDLGRLEVFRLGVALALTAAPRLLAVDDVGHKLPADEHAAVWALLRELADGGLTVLAVGEPPSGLAALTVHTTTLSPTTPVKEDV